MNKAFLLCCISLLSLVQPLSLRAEDPAQGAEPVQPGSSWLGVMVGPLSIELRTQLSAYLPSEEGLLVEWVAPDSPAERAGIRRFDVLLSFAGQKLYSAEQLFSLVRYSNPHSEVELTLIQQGRPRSVSTTLDVREPRMLGRTRRPLHSIPPRPGQIPAPPEPPSVWDLFESVQVQTLADGRYRARISYRNSNDESVSFTFEGDKQEIEQQIRQQQELPADKQRALLRALNMGSDRIPELGYFEYLDDFLRSQRFGRDPFDHPFFRDPAYLEPYFQGPYYGPWQTPPWQLHVYPDLPDHQQP